ncbi:hypothetical protein [Streptomyces sp. NPDC048442]|uniref:hypothetical protein n=1 Tax=Streptomyces sp. NPDC048442 TaxID=3154823 RepID=UPI003430A79A
MTDSLWDRLSAPVRAEVDDLVADGRNIQAIVAMRERAGVPVPEIRECVDLLAERCTVLRGQNSA